MTETPPDHPQGQARELAEKIMEKVKAITRESEPLLTHPVIVEQVETLIVQALRAHEHTDAATAEAQHGKDCRIRDAEWSAEAFRMQEERDEALTDLERVSVSRDETRDRVERLESELSQIRETLKQIEQVAGDAAEVVSDPRPYVFIRRLAHGADPNAPERAAPEEK